MSFQAPTPTTEPTAGPRTATRLGFAAAVTMVPLTLAAFAVGIATPPRSGPWCLTGCIAYPYSEIAPFFPRDYLWIFPAILLPPLFVAIAASVHVCARPSVRPLSLLGLCSATMASTVLVLDYFVQLLVVQPSLLHAETHGIAILTQYNPHGLFIALEDLGYLWLGIAFLFVGAAIPSAIPLGRRLRWLLMAAGLAVPACFLAMAWRFRSEMAAPTELALISIDWFTLILSGILFAVYFRRTERTWVCPDPATR